jgi:hypothetical protein
MMLFSRFWYVILGLAVAVSVYVVFLAVGQYNRRNLVVMKEGLASDSQTVEWALKIDSRRRLDAGLPGSVDPAIQTALTGANGKDKIPPKSRDDAKKALQAVNDKIPADYRSDALFAVDRDGRVIASVGYDAIAGNDDFELGGYAAVYDALHGYLRDDTWVLGSRMYLVFARPVEYDVTQRPAGAIVGLKEVNKKFAVDIAKRTRTSVAFFAAGQRVTAATGIEGFEESQLEQIASALGKLGDDKSYETGGRSDTVMLSDDLGAMYARLPGDAWDLHAGFAVVRARVSIAGPMGFLSGADDKDKASVPWLLLVGVTLLSMLVGIGLTLLEHTLPLREMVVQARKLKTGAVDGLQATRFRGAYRGIALDLNAGTERILEKGGGPTRKPADLELILGPTPAQPAMAAFSFPNAANNAAADIPPVPPAAPGPPAPSSGPHSPAGASPPPRPAPLAPGQGPPPISRPNLPVARPEAPAAAFPPPQRNAPPAPAVAPPAPAPPVLLPKRTIIGTGAPAPSLNTPSPNAPSLNVPPAPAKASPPAAGARPAPPTLGAARGAGPGEDDEEATMVGSAPADVMAQAGGEAANESAEWLTVYEDFIRTKKQCAESTDGLTFEKFSLTLRKNRDALIQRHGCKRVRFSVYVKEGRASLKATPVKE